MSSPRPTLAAVGALEPWHLIVILGISLIVFGPGKLTELGGQLGKGVREFRELSEGRGPTMAERFCSQCGARSDAVAKHCAQCGAGLGVGSAS
jgi:TatA/E family protein of Tat protein translocase